MHDLNDIVIDLKNVRYSVSGSIILDDVSFSIKRGEYIGIVGPNGGGKTTVIRIILGLLSPDSGIVRVLGQDVSRLDHKERIAYVPQKAAHSTARFPATAAEVVASGRTARLGAFRQWTERDTKAVNRAFDITGTSALKNRLVHHLSGGERQRVLIARALVSEPEILVLDEPVAGVDAPSQRAFYGFLRQLKKEHRMTILFVSHDIEIITHEADHVLYINRRRVDHEHALHEFLHDAGHRSPDRLS